MEILKEYKDFKTLSQKIKPKQMDAINAIFENKNVVVVLPTGGGKSLCFQLPALASMDLTIVISPLISLINDQIIELRSNGINCGCYCSSNSQNENKITLQAIEEKSISLLYTTPESIMSESLSNSLFKTDVSRIVFDEAHCILNWGIDFRKSYLQICNFINEHFNTVPKSILSATCSNEQLETICTLLHIKEKVVIRDTLYRPNLNIEVIEKTKSVNAFKDICKFLNMNNSSGIIYCLSKKDCDKYAEKLNDLGIPAQSFHSEKKNKKEILEDWKNNKIRIVVATIAFGMGINKSDVRFVIHLNMPKSIDSYYQEIGRAGRDGLPAHCITYFNYADKNKHHQMSLKNDDVIAEIYKMYQYCIGSICRQKQINEYFCYSIDDCKNCDNCNNLKRLTPVNCFPVMKDILGIIKTSGYAKNYVFKALENMNKYTDYDIEFVINYMVCKNYIIETMDKSVTDYYMSELCITKEGTRLLNQERNEIVFFKNMKLSKLAKSEIIDNIVDAEFLQFYKAIKNIVNLDKNIIETLYDIRPKKMKTLLMIKGIDESIGNVNLETILLICV